MTGPVPNDGLQQGDRYMLRVFSNGHRLPRQRFQRQPSEAASIAEVISEFERPFLDGDADLASSGRFREFSSSSVEQFRQGEGTIVPETQDGPAWSAHRPPEYEAPPNQTPRAFRILKGGSVDYDDRDARFVVEVWRGQRRHPDSTPTRTRQANDPNPQGHWPGVTADFWRYEESGKMALRLGTGTVARSQDEANDPDVQYDPDDMSMNYAKEIVFQQLDMHPIRGSWNNKQKCFLAAASPDEPLAFLDFIEDAALAIPPACRRKLPRCLRVGTRADSDMFKKPTAGVSRWPDGSGAGTGAGAGADDVDTDEDDDEDD